MKDRIEQRVKECTTFLEVKMIIDDWMDYYNNERYQWSWQNHLPTKIMAI